jgi:hypothetical protein
MEVTVLHKAQQTLEAPLGYNNTLAHPLHTTWLCISLCLSSSSSLQQNIKKPMSEKLKRTKL